MGRVVIAAVVFVGLCVVPLALAGQCWRRVERRAVWRFRALPPFEPKTWRGALLLRAWRRLWALAGVMLSAMLGAVVAVDLGDGRGDIGRWLVGVGRLTVVLAVFVLIGVVAEVSFTLWRITRQDDWPHRRLATDTHWIFGGVAVVGGALSLGLLPV